MKRLLLIASILFYSIAAFAQSLPNAPLQKSDSAEKKASTQERGTDQFPFVIRLLPTEQTENTQLKNSNVDVVGMKPEADWNLSDKIALIASIAAFLQFLTLIATVVVMIRGSRRQLRAYLLPFQGGIFEGLMMNPPIPARANDIWASLLFRNSGQTPAYKIITWMKIEVLEPVNEDKLIVTALEKKFPSVLGAGADMPKTSWYGRALTPNEIVEINNQVKAIYCYGRVEYEDAFKIFRYSNFRFRYNGPFPPPMGVLWLTCQEGNDAN